jgi:hypothetical protein
MLKMYLTISLNNNIVLPILIYQLSIIDIFGMVSLKTHQMYITCHF